MWYIVELPYTNTGIASTGDSSMLYTMLHPKGIRGAVVDITIDHELHG